MRNIRNVLIDIDGTFSHMPQDAYYNKTVGGNYPLGILADIVKDRFHVSFGEAVRKVEQLEGDNVCLFEACEKVLGITAKMYWNPVMTWHKKYLRIYPDAVYLIKQLHKRGINLYTATTNSRRLTILKLASAGLANRNGSRYFKGFFGGDSIKTYHKTNDPEFYLNIIKIAGINPEQTVMIGDDIKADRAVPKKAGLRSIVVDRTRKKKIFCNKEGDIFVNSLAHVPDILTPSLPCRPGSRK